MRENNSGTDGSGGDDRTTSSSFTVIDDDDHQHDHRSRRRHRDHHGHRDRQDHRDQHPRDRDPRHFARSLDSKLKKLQQRHPGDGVKQRSSRKPVFVTTVKTGIFLDPPPDLAALLGLDDRSSQSGVDSDRYYSYSSKPRVLHDRQHQRCTVSYSCRKTDGQPDMCKQMGYTNIMHDKRVVRGSNFAKKSFMGKESPAAREAEARRRAMARKKAIDYQTRAMRLHLGAPKLPRGRQNVDIQTDVHLEELYDYPVSQTFGAQTEFDQEMFSNPGTGTSAGTDASTQVDDKDLFDFDTEVTPIAEALISDAFRTAMQEVLYEDELETRARQQRALCMRRKVEEIEMKRLQYQDERLKQVIAEHTKMFDEGDEREKQRISSTLTSDRVTDLLPKVLDDLSEKGLTTTTGNKLESPEFVAWLTEELQADKTKHAESDEILKSMIHDLISRRLDSYNETTDVKDIERPEELFKEIESITLESDKKIESDSSTKAAKDS
ncbi:radial spoke head protein 3 homolog B isoform X2 [Metopolophium dirhodum]|uniref:radial spoke head protein 3 homolog B isoform X2 n=1 Tax=Metopolophium dirhodum TaxID=44670 RepID=UPI0029900818|nr:radial spoke head protein 3 homolog B isoform X2 [Metopolophium dirhodum]